VNAAAEGPLSPRERRADGDGGEGYH